jgi:hypothetical protein
MNTVSRLLLRIASLLLLALRAQGACANYVVCATSAQDLTNKLHDGTSPDIGQPYIIRVQEGTYTFTVDLEFGYSSDILRQPIYIQDGYRAPNCTGGRDIDYRQTVLDLGGHGVDLWQKNSSLSSNLL